MLKGRGAPGFALGGALMPARKQMSSHGDVGLPVVSHLRSDLWRVSMCSRVM